MSDDVDSRLAAAKERLEDIEKRIGRFMPKVKTRDGVKRGQWRSDHAFIRGDGRGKTRRKA